MKWTEEKVLEVIHEARVAGYETARNRLADLQSCDPNFVVMDGSKCVGSLLDVCGFANLKISARGKFYLLAKKLSENIKTRFYCSPANYSGGILSIFDSTMRQEMSVNVAACQGQAKVLARYGIVARVESRID